MENLLSSLERTMIDSKQNCAKQSNLCCIIIPIYKNEITKHETIALKQCCSILRKYTIIFITHDELDCSAYTSICKHADVSFRYEYFKKKYFNGIVGYNALLLSNIFYKKFDAYKFMLVYQLDAYVFRDELEYWCNQDYDYIGAPWMSFRSIEENPAFGSKYNLTVGNGGFCLRKIDTFVRFNSPNIFLAYYFFEICIFFNSLKEKSKKNIFFMFIRCILFPVKIIIDKIDSLTRDRKNEDVLWAKALQPCSKMPNAYTAMRFSFEAYCDYLYELSDYKLPFGCHGWFEYYRWKLFWKKIIPSDGFI